MTPMSPTLPQPSPTLPFGADTAITRTAEAAPVAYDPRLQMSVHQNAPVITDPAKARPWLATNFEGDTTLPKWD